MPPAFIRRPVTVTVWLIVSAAAMLASPLLLGRGSLASALAGRPEPLIIARLTIAYFLRELVGLVACGVLWLRAGAGRRIDTPRSQRAHWRLVGWFFGGLAATGRRVLDIDVSPEPSAEAWRALESDQPLIVFSRHAGPGDTIFIIDELVSRFHRRPSVVFKESLAIDPCVDLLAHRLPQAMLNPSDRDESRARIADLTAGLGPRGVLLLFPEGGNFTPERRRSALRRLWRTGRRREAARAEQMQHVMPPRPGGALTALAARGEADVVFAAHTGLGLAAYPGQFWRDMPIGRTLHTRLWLVRSAEVPDDPDQQVDWLYDWWERIDEWIDGPHPGAAKPETV